MKPAIIEEILRAWRDATNCYLAGAGLPPLKDLEAEHNAGARLADDRFCLCCGARGYRFLCPRCRS